jgi:hypothetical protein
MKGWTGLKIIATKLHHIVVTTLAVIVDTLPIQITTKAWEDARQRLEGYGFSKILKNPLGKLELLARKNKTTLNNTI